MRRQTWLSLIIVGPPTGLALLFATTAARQLQRDLTVIAVIAYLGVLSVSIHGWLRLQELRQEKHFLELQLKSLERDKPTPNHEDRDLRSSPTSGHLATVFMFRRRDNAGGP